MADVMGVIGVIDPNDYKARVPRPTNLGGGCASDPISVLFLCQKSCLDAHYQRHSWGDDDATCCRQYHLPEIFFALTAASDRGGSRMQCFGSVSWR